MRTLVLLRGVPGCGKSTFVKNNNLEQYTISSDDIRLMCSGITLTLDGKEQINQAGWKFVWDTLFSILEERMENGLFTVVDATNIKAADIKKYKKLCERYRYRLFCVDFSDIPLDICKQQNLQRPEYKQVPDEVIERMYSNLLSETMPSGITVVKPDELNKVWFNKLNFSEYKKIHHIGDVHGCYTALTEYFDKDGGIKDDEMYIFTGDLLDRGIENAEVLKFVLSIYEKPNVCLIEGNHEIWLRKWSNDEFCESKEFRTRTQKQLEDANISKKDVRQLCRKIRQCAYYSYGDNDYLVTHGGLSTMPENLTLVSTTQLIKGVGDYADAKSVDNAFLKNAPNNCVQIHGHRNVVELPVQVNERCFNLEGQVEFGGNLRCVQVFPDGKIAAYETKNEVFRVPDECESLEESPVEFAARLNVNQKSDLSVGDTISLLRRNKYVQEKKFGNISSFNFTSEAFYEKVWNEQTTKARGLYINTKSKKVVARAYNKFFNIGERPETELESLKHSLSFPVTAYVKENGFLGIVSYNEEDDSLFVTTKSNPEGIFAQWLRDMLENKLGSETLEKIKQYCKNNDVSFVFECVDMKNDPHIIEYKENKLFLLDIVSNELEFKKYSFDKMCEVADSFGISHKEKAVVLTDWNEFVNWYNEVETERYKYNDRNIEGFVLEDSAGSMIKIKLVYYKFWKQMRSVAQEVLKRGVASDKKLASLDSKGIQFYEWIKGLQIIKDVDFVPKDICSLRKMFLLSEKANNSE